MPKLKLTLAPKLQQTLTPQQIQYLKLLQLPTLQLEQYIKQELEENPMLEEISEDFEQIPWTERASEPEMLASGGEYDERTPYDGGVASEIGFDASSIALSDSPEQPYTTEADRETMFDYFTEQWGQSEPSHRTEDDEENEPFIERIRDVPSFEEELLEQVQYLNLTPAEQILAEQIIGSLEYDGYLRRPLKEVLEEANDRIADMLFERAQRGEDAGGLAPLRLEDAERILGQIQLLEPAGCGSRNLKECLIAQLRALPERTAHEQIALRVLEEAFDDLAEKHYGEIATKLKVSEDDLRHAVDVIRRLNPKPGYGGQTFTDAALTIVPDFIVERDEESGDLLVSLNDSLLPRVRLSEAYQQLRRQAQKSLNRETRQWLHRKQEDAKFLLAALQQRKVTMLKVMTAIAHLQRRFFEQGPSGLRPLIYKDVADATGLDISTVCRVVSGKYVQTEYGIFELRYFFSESLLTDNGEEVSTRVIKELIRKLIEDEPKSNPLSDNKISKELKKRGYNVARRTVAKYREQMKIPIARLRRGL